MNSPVHNILVVDDEPNNFDVIETFLSDQDYELYYASNGESALASIEAINPSIILLDVMMPGMDGIELCRKIKAMPQWLSVPIIMVTALNSKEDLARCLNSGADDFVTKPVNSTELRARVRSMIRLKQQYDSIKNLSKMQNHTIEILQNSLGELSGNLVSTLPHELNTPLNGIIGSIDILLEECETMTREELKEFLWLAKESAKRLEKLTRKFLNYAYLEISPHQVSYNKPQYPLEPICDRLFILSIAQEQAKKDGRIEDLICELTQEKVAVSEHDMKLILCELLENAFKVSKLGTPVKLTSHRVDGKIHFAIADQGWGMTEEQISKVGAFVQFERKQHEQQGAELGLKIVTKLVEKYGGEFSIASIYKQETTVSWKLPCKDSHLPC
ncbi:hybrid sensor histidine kinase/response regulator [Pseudanabaena sp. FACHB-1998]|uniref:hybrid sensor histidine kinase/response regulator n=1 Tax=Pseudanabaena sp. FACHB-1998 TaxID=2692858 RepID=UPI001681C1B5|nr:hybrid sensor histidine kinase/response regulator [Pseudanabaena sp. FACHB-1998]MBD2177644.1 hybrid sensor histidine kinase/response regulator [Pseudanabaena sp. FACHB-1998]